MENTPENNRHIGIQGLIDRLKNTERVLTDKESNSIIGDDMEIAFDAIRHVTALRLGELRSGFNECEQGINRIGSLDFSQPIKVSETDHVVSYLAQSLNILMEELALRIFPFQSYIIDHISDLIIATDRNGKIYRVNKQVEELTGYTNEELENKSIVELIDPSTLSINLSDGFTIKNQKINFITKDKNKTEVTLTIEEIKAYRNTTAGYIFIAK